METKDICPSESGKRQEKDALGIVWVPKESYWGANTERARHNFSISLYSASSPAQKMPHGVLRGLAFIKAAAAYANHQLGDLPLEKYEAITQACEEILTGQWDDQFPLSLWQSGSGTQSNMNMNEVVANRANEILGFAKGEKRPVHPNDDVNRSQSTNDCFPTALHIATLLALQNDLLPGISHLQKALREKSNAFQSILKIGRTHLQDATPLTVGQEFSAFADLVAKGLQRVKDLFPALLEIAQGGTAVGTGINTRVGFVSLFLEALQTKTGFAFTSAPNKFEALSHREALVTLSGALNGLAVSCLKIANDIRWLASGPRGGLQELILPANEPGSSIMPGKVNPTQAEVLAMIAVQVMGNHLTVSLAGSQGNLQLNVFMPVMIHNILHSIQLLAEGGQQFAQKCVEGIEVNTEKLAHDVERSLMLVTALAPHIGYDKSAEIAQKSLKENIALKEAAQEVAGLSEETFERFVDPWKMISPSEKEPGSS